MVGSSDLEGQSRSSKAVSRNDGGNKLWTILMMFLLVFLGSLNFILVKAMYNAFGSSYAFFANQGVNLLYVLYGGAILQQKMLCTNKITPEMRTFPQKTFFKLSILDAFGTFSQLWGLYTHLWNTNPY